MKMDFKKILETAKAKVIFGAAVIGGLAMLLANIKLIISIFKKKQVELIDVSYLTNDSIDVKLRNLSSEVSVLKRYEIEIKKKWRLEPDDIGRSFLPSSATYNLEIDTQREPPYNIASDLSQMIEAGKPDRFYIVVAAKDSPDKPAGSVVLLCDLTIEFDKSRSLEKEGLFIFLPDKNAIYEKASSNENMKDINEIAEPGGIRSKALQEFIASFKR